jgi:hypothetical protein
MFQYSHEKNREMFLRLQLHFLKAYSLAKTASGYNLFQITLVKTLLRADRDRPMDRDHSLINHEQLCKEFE